MFFFLSQNLSYPNANCIGSISQTPADAHANFFYIIMWIIINYINRPPSKYTFINLFFFYSNGSKCNHLTTINKSMFSTCGQKYSYRRLLTVSHEGVLESDIFEFPVACVCLVKSYRYWNLNGFYASIFRTKMEKNFCTLTYEEIRLITEIFTISIF